MRCRGGGNGEEEEEEQKRDWIRKVRAKKSESREDVKMNREGESSEIR